jgi:capsular exopolysaccharide synthesis family protein
MDVDNPTRVVVVTSPLPGDGKSTVAANLAAALAAAGSSVVLIDGDLRRPVVAESFGLVEGVGLTDVLVGQVNMEDALQEVNGMSRMRVLSAGRIPPNPSELLGSESMARLLAKLAESHTVVIDAPPLLPITDAAVLTAVADGALIVISSRRTLDTQLRDSIRLIEKVQGKTLGVVFNRVTKRDSTAGYYGEYYGYQPRRKADLEGKPVSKRKSKKRNKRRGADLDDVSPAEMPTPTSRQY